MNIEEIYDQLRSRILADEQLIRAIGQQAAEIISQEIAREAAAGRYTA